MKPIVIFDLETTGKNPQKDRIVQIGMMVVSHDLKDILMPLQKQLVNPEVPIPTEATAIHGITNEMVKDAPKFGQIAGAMKNTMDQCDLAGYNSNKFDIPMVMAEFERTGIIVDLLGKKMLDAMKVYHHFYKRDLTAALMEYTGEVIQDAHDAGSDVEATYKVLLAQMTRHPELTSTDEVDKISGSETRVDINGNFIRDIETNNILVNFGLKCKGLPAKDNLDYLDWILKNDFPEETKKWCTKIIEEHRNGSNKVG